MFDENNKSENSENKKQVEDIFSGTEKVSESPLAEKKPDVFSPKHQEVSNEKTEVSENKKLKDMDFKKYIVLGSIIFILILIGFAAYFTYNNFFKTDLSNKNLESNIVEDVVDKQPEVNQQIQEEVNPNEVIMDDFTENEEEIDSDDDGLFDREEVKVYKTDPNNPDTDGDGYYDGDEVKSGYNPSGAGKMFEIE